MPEKNPSVKYTQCARSMCVIHTVPSILYVHLPLHDVQCIVFVSLVDGHHCQSRTRPCPCTWCVEPFP